MAYKAVIAVLIAALAVVGGCIIYDNMVNKDDPVTPDPEDPSGTYYSITYVLNGGTADPASPSVYKSGEKTYLGTPTKTVSGHALDFLGWYTDSGLTQRIQYISESSTGNKTVYAKWSDSGLPVWSIQYELNGGTAVSELPTQYVEGEVTVLGTLVKVENSKSFKFLGWSLDEEMSSIITEIGEDMSGDIKLYACWSEPEKKNSYSITYVLNGGTADTSSPSSYRAGNVTDLGCPTKTDYLFMGWYLDAACTECLLYVPADMVGDLTLFASWDTDVVGHGYQFDTETTNTDVWFGQKYKTISYGTFSYTYLHYDDDKGYLYKRVTGTQLKDGSYSYRETVEWQSSDDPVEETEYEENVTVEIGDWKVVTDKVTVSLYNGNYVEAQYYIYGWLLVKMESSYQSYSSLQTTEFTLTDVLTYASQPTYTIKAYSDKGLTVEGAGTYDAYSQNVTLTVSCDDGTEFAGWYNEDGLCVGNDATYVINLVLSDVTVYALNSSDTDYTAQKGKEFTISTSTPLKNTEWVLEDDSGKEVFRTVSESFSYTFSECGTFVITYSGLDDSGKAVSKIGSILVDGTVTKTYDWSYGDGDYSAQLDIKYSDYSAYVNNTITRTQGTSSHDLQFVTYNDKYIKSLASQIADQTEGMSDEDRITVILRFVQSIPYVTDSESAGTSEYFKFPLETLYEYGGDCEDTTFLFCAIGKAMGYDVAILYFEGHAAASINMEEVGYDRSNVSTESCRSYYRQYQYYVLDVGGSTVTYLYPGGSFSKDYYLYCETTAESDAQGNIFNIGDVPYYKTYSAGENPYSSLNVEKVIPVV